MCMLLRLVVGLAVLRVLAMGRVGSALRIAMVPIFLVMAGATIAVAWSMAMLQVARETSALSWIRAMATEASKAGRRGMMKRAGRASAKVL